MDPGFAYAYTLLGHEFVLTEELDRALACFRNAIRVNNRHYNAWYVPVSIYTLPYQESSISASNLVCPSCWGGGWSTVTTDTEEKNYIVTQEEVVL